MSQKTPDLPSSHPLSSGRRWEFRACLLVFLCIFLVWTDIFAGWTATPAHAATVSNPHPVLRAPSLPQTPKVAHTPDLGVYVQGQQRTTLVPIPHPQIKMPTPQTVTLTTTAQQVLSRDGTFELDVAAGSVSNAQI